MTQPNQPLILSFLSLRQAVGLIGFLLPIVLSVGKIILERWGIQPSISDYYYTSMRDVFVGSLFVVAAFLLSYRGFDSADRISSFLAGLSALGVAIFPTTPKAIPSTMQVVGYVHVAFATCFFLILAYMAIVLFRKTDSKKPPTQEKKWRNTVYLVCGVLILFSIVMIGMLQLLPATSPLLQRDPVFWFEWLMLWAFGISWFVKGEGLLADKPQ